MDARNIDLLVILTGFLIVDNKFQREVTVFTRNNSKQLFDDTTTFLLSTDLRAEPQYTDIAQQLSQNGYNIIFLKQNNPGASRKQVQPWLDKFFADKY